MEIIQIEDSKDNIVLYLDGEKISGKKFNSNNTVENIDRSVLNYFEIFQLSNDRMPLDNEGEYQVILDKRTKFKHYFKNGVEDLEMFFFNNGEDATLYFGDASKNNKKQTKKFSFGKVAITLLLTALLTFAPKSLNALVVVEGDKLISPKPDITCSDIYNGIYKIEGLTTSEKERLYNEDLFYQILPYVNQSEYAKAEYWRRLGKVNFEVFEPGKYDCGGFYSSATNTIAVCSDYRDDVLPHEFMHWLQVNDGFYLSLVEGYTELFAQEFLGKEGDKSAKDIILIKKIIELFGIDAAEKYNFGHNYSQMDKIAKENLTPEQYERFMICLKGQRYATWVPEEEKEAVNQKNALYRDELIELVDIIAKNLGVEFDEEELKDKPCLNFELMAEYEKNIILNSIESSMKEGYLTGQKYDWKGNYLGEATYEEICDLPGRYYYVIKRNTENCDGQYAFDNLGTKPEISEIPEWSNISEEKLITFEEYAKQYKVAFGETNEYARFYPNSTKNHFDYPNGSTVDILEDGTIIYKDKEGKEESYKSEAPIKVQISDSGYICWSIESKEVYDEKFRFIYPDGLKEEIKILDGDEYYQWNHRKDSDLYSRRVKVEFSTGESFYDIKETYIPCNISVDETLVPLHDRFLVMDWVDKDGNNIGVRTFSDSGLEWFDNDENMIMFQDTLLSNKFEMYNKNGEVKEVTYENGTTAYYRDYDCIGYTYSNGRSVRFENNELCFYDEEGNPIDLGIGSLVFGKKYSYSLSDPYYIHLRNENPLFREADDIYIAAGKYMKGSVCKYTEDLTGEHLEDILIYSKEIGPQTKKID